MKLIMSIVNSSDEREVTEAMMRGGFYVTKIGSSGGLMKKKLTTLISTVHDEQKDAALEIISKSTHIKKYHAPVTLADSVGIPLSNQREVVVGGATVFVLNVEEVLKY